MGDWRGGMNAEDKARVRGIMAYNISIGRREELSNVMIADMIDKALFGAGYRIVEVDWDDLRDHLLYRHGEDDEGPNPHGR